MKNSFYEHFSGFYYHHQAAGFSRRMGRDKLSLQYKGKTILEHSLDTVLRAGLNEIILVTGSHSILPKAINSLPIRVIVNRLSSSGLASSLQAGLQAVDNRCPGVIFALADQPLLSVEIYQNLIENYRNKIKLVTVPTYKDKRGNPTIFDRRTWPKLMKIRGDRCGREIIKSLPDDEVDLIETSLPAIIQDIDTETEYEELS